MIMVCQRRSVENRIARQQEERETRKAHKPLILVAVIVLTANAIATWLVPVA